MNYHTIKSRGLIRCVGAALAIIAIVAAAPAAFGQARPYIGFVYPAGGRQGETFQIRLGGQGLEDANAVYVSGPGVTAKVTQCNRVLNNQETALLSEQVRILKRSRTNAAPAMMADTAQPMMMMQEPAMMDAGNAAGRTNSAPAATGADTEKLIALLEKRIAETVSRPASAALAGIVFVEVTVAADAPPGQRELRLATPRGISNPMVFQVGQLPEFNRKPMITAQLQVLGKEAAALRKRPDSEVEDRVTIPCTLNGQIASGELNRYRFAARKGQKLVITTLARQLIPYIADAVPGWFQPVLALYDPHGKEVAYDDDYRFKADPTILCEAPEDGDYVLDIYDAIYRGREDFVYRITIGEVPFVTSIFPLGAPAGSVPEIRMKGWNLEGAVMTQPPTENGPGIHMLTARKEGFAANPVPFAFDTLPEKFEAEPNNSPAQAQKITLPVIINGRINTPDDWDVYQIEGKSNETVVAEVWARRLDSPLDSILKLTDSSGKLVAFNDDREDLRSGLNTHHADSWLMAKLPWDGAYYIHIGDTARAGGDEYGYRLRISGPRPDFALRVVPSSASLRGKSTATVSVHAIRTDGFAGPIKLTLKDPPAGISATPISLAATQTVAKLNLKSDLKELARPVNLHVVGTARIEQKDVVREAVPAEDRMQAFYWRHLVPSENLVVMVYDPSIQAQPRRVPRERPAKPTMSDTNSTVAATSGSVTNKAKFTKQQVAGRLRELKRLFEDGLITDDFYDAKVTECEAAL